MTELEKQTFDKANALIEKNKQIEEMSKDIYSILRIDTMSRAIASMLYGEGYRKSSEVAREVTYDFQNRLRHIFLDMCDYNDYGTLNLLQIDGAIEALYDTFIAELKKKYTKEE